jgi:hypothetical protein
MKRRIERTHSDEEDRREEHKIFPGYEIYLRFVDLSCKQRSAADGLQLPSISNHNESSETPSNSKKSSSSSVALPGLERR